jgi:hypothetical protein
MIVAESLRLGDPQVINPRHVDRVEPYLLSGL